MKICALENIKADVFTTNVAVFTFTTGISNPSYSNTIANFEMLNIAPNS
jgi:hypothetical protein